MTGEKSDKLYQTAMLQKQAYKRLRQCVNSVLTQKGLNVAQWFVLSALQVEGKDTPARIAERLGYDRPNLTVLLRNLEDKQFTKEEINSVDKRSKLIGITPRGRATLRRVSVETKVELRKILKDITIEELNNYISVLRKLAEI